MRIIDLMQEDGLTMAEAYERVKEREAKPVRPITKRELANVLAALSLARRFPDEFPYSNWFDTDLPLGEAELLELQNDIYFGKLDFQNPVDLP